MTEKVFGEWPLHKRWPRNSILNRRLVARVRALRGPPRRAVGDARAAERGEKTQALARLTRTLFFFCQTPLPLPELFRNRGALRPVLWMQRFVCILPSNKSGPVLFLMKSRSGVLLRERTNTNAHTGAVRSVPLRRPVSVQGNSHLSRMCLIIL